MRTKTNKQYEVIYKDKNDTIEHAWKCWATTKESAKYQFLAQFEDAKVIRVNKM